MTLPKNIVIHEVGPREGMQIERKLIATADKVRLVDSLSECNFHEIEVTSFVSPKWVPQMADAEEIVSRIRMKDGTRYTGIYLNSQGIARAVKTGRLDVEGSLSVTASETFSKKNTNRTIEETLRDTEVRIDMLGQMQVPTHEISVMAAFGCNYEGDIAPTHVIGLIDRLMRMAVNGGLDIRLIQLADTMGWGNPQSVRALVSAVRERWPLKRINLHLHDTRGMGLMNAYAAMELGVDDFDSAVGGLGGCPYAGFKNAPGNIATEDLVHLCNEIGVDTGIDLDRLIEVAREAEAIVGHPLPGKVMRGGNLRTYRMRSTVLRV